MKTTGNESFKEHDFGMAVTRYIQVGNVLKDIRAVRDEENEIIDELMFKATRNLTLAALKNWEWARAKRACDTVEIHVRYRSISHHINVTGAWKK